MKEGLNVAKHIDGRDWDQDRWIEALLGARLRFHASWPGPHDSTAYWERVYRRWGQLYTPVTAWPPSEWHGRGRAERGVVT